MNKIGRFGEYGGQYVPEIVMNAVNELNEAYETYKNDPEFLAQLRQLYRDYANRPSLLYYAEKMTKDLGGAKVYLKREDLNHTGAHKINNVLGQILLAKRMGKKRIIAETGAGQHGVATATVAALFDMECVVYMGAEDVERQSLNAYRMELLGAKVHAVESGTRTLKDAINEAMRDWATNIETTFYCIGSVMGPHPYPTMVRDFQKIIGEETKEQMKEIMREEMQVADDKIYDDVIASMESRFEELKKSEINIPFIKEIGDMSFEETVDKIIEKWANSENTAEEINDKNVLVMRFVELPQHYSYANALFSSEE